MGGKGDLLGSGGSKREIVVIRSVWTAGWAKGGGKLNLIGDLGRRSW